MAPVFCLARVAAARGGALVPRDPFWRDELRAGVLKAWLDPMPDGTLPNSTIRATILKLLDVLPIDCAMEDRKEQLKRSELGKSVMFLAKVSGAPGGRGAPAAPWAPWS